MRLKSLFIPLIVVVIVLAYFSLYTVNQTQQAIILRLGKIEVNSKGDPIIKTPGLHIKWPFISTVKKFDMRLRTLSINSSRIVTVEQKDVIVDAFVKWRIKDIVSYYKSTGGNELRADVLLRQKVSDGMRAEFGKQTILELVSGQRANVMKLLQSGANEVAKPLGISVTDVRVKKIDLPEEVTDSVYARMRSNREKEAYLIRSQGKESAELTKATGDAQVTVLLAKAKSDAAKIRAQGDKEAAQLYATAYQSDPKFYGLYRALESYQKVFDGSKQPTLVLRPQGQFFSAFNQLDAKAK